MQIAISTKSINQRLIYVSKLNPESVWLPIYKMEEYIEDSITKKVLIQRNDYLSGYRERDGLGQLKVWMIHEKCDVGNKSLLAFGAIHEKFINLVKGN